MISKIEGIMTKTIKAVYEHNVLRPLRPVRGLKEHQRVELTLHIPSSKKGLGELAHTLSQAEAKMMAKIIEDEFERIENGW